MEEWRAVVGYEGFYEVSDLGNVRSLRTKRLRRFSITDWGYYHVGLSKNGVAKDWRVHRLVAMAFVPLIDGKTHVNHINGDKLDNRAANLEWVTKRENEEHARLLGRHHAITNPNRGWKLSVADVIDIRSRHASGERVSDIHKDYSHVNSCHLYRITQGRGRKLG